MYSFFIYSDYLFIINIASEKAVFNSFHIAAATWSIVETLKLKL